MTAYPRVDCQEMNLLHSGVSFVVLRLGPHHRSDIKDHAMIFKTHAPLNSPYAITNDGCGQTCGKCGAAVQLTCVISGDILPAMYWLRGPCNSNILCQQGHFLLAKS